MTGCQKSECISVADFSFFVLGKPVKGAPNIAKWGADVSKFSFGDGL